MKLGEIIRKEREARSHSLRFLASELEITPSYLSDIENDRRVPSEPVLEKIADGLSLNFYDLMAACGRFGVEAGTYMRQHPDAIRIIQICANANLDDEALADLRKIAEKLVALTD